jgi:hypothetical protein
MIIIPKNLILKQIPLIVSLTAVLIYYWPALISLGYNAGQLYTGDLMGYYTPGIIKTHELLRGLNFTAIDFSLFNGSSEFYLSPNFFAVHPLLVLYGLLVPFSIESIHIAGFFLVLMLAIHSFVAIYFCIKLLVEFFEFSFELALLVGIGFSFSIYMVAAMTQPPFLLTTSMIPWICYSSLVYLNRGCTAKNLLCSAFPIICCTFGGYIPLGFFSILFSFLIVQFRQRYIYKSCEKFSNIRISIAPYFLAFIVTGPYLLAAYIFHKSTTSSSSASIFYSAHQLAELPQGLLRLISDRINISSPLIEFTPVWGPILITILILFLFSNAYKELSDKEWKIVKVCSTIYFFLLIAIYGDYSVVSDLIYYFVPQIGKMHIYQRFLMAGQLILLMTAAIMFEAILRAKCYASYRIALVILGFLTIWSAISLTANIPFLPNIKSNNYLILEFFTASVFVATLFVPGRLFQILALIFLLNFPILNKVYDLSHGGHAFNEQVKRLPVVLDKKVSAEILNYFEKFENKDVIKYLDLTPIWTKEGIEAFPKEYPYLMLPKNKFFSSFGGFTFYLSSRSDYLSKMPVQGDLTINPNWDFISKKGADFAIVTPADLQKASIQSMLSGLGKAEIFNLPNGNKIIPLKEQLEEVLYDNGYIRLEVPQDRLPTYQNLAINKFATQISDGGGIAKLAIDGNRDGNFTNGSVTHTGLNANAWLDIDLGKTEKIDAIKVWNRIDCCPERLNDYWVFISDSPFLAGEASDTLRSRTKTYSYPGKFPNPTALIKTPEAIGRYVRLQLAGKNNASGNYLSVAEVEVLKRDDKEYISTSNEEVKISSFYTNNANSIKINFKNNFPVELSYLFSYNPHISFKLNGNTIEANLRGDEIKFAIPPGENYFEVIYNNNLLNLFWIIYGLYFIFLINFLFPELFNKISKITNLYKRKL